MRRFPLTFLVISVLMIPARSLSMKAPADKVSLVVSKSLFVAAQKAVAIGLPVGVPEAEDGKETEIAVLVEMRTLRVIALTPAAVVRARVQAILVAAFVGVEAIPVTAVIR